MKSRESAGRAAAVKRANQRPPVRADGGRYRNLLWQNGKIA